MTDGITWAVRHAGQGTYAHMDTSRISAAGMSCGGIEAYAQASTAQHNRSVSGAGG